MQLNVNMEGIMECRENCGACCIAPSITSKIPGMPEGKQAGEKCIQLDEYYKCKIFGSPERPKVCSCLKASEEMCGSCREDALRYLDKLEELTK